jgi:signal transduction histidine kinase
MSRNVNFEQIREQAESLLRQYGHSHRRDDATRIELERELNVRDLELELLREQIEQTQKRLADWIAERTAELEAANRSLKAEIRVRSAIESRLRTNRERLRSLAVQLEEVEERERRRIAANLHDLIGQTLASANMKLGLLVRTASDSTQRQEIEEVRRLNQRMLNETRTIISELSPRVLEEQDMRTATSWLIDHFEENHDLTITFDDELDDAEIPFELRRFLFRTLRELLFNVKKHSQSSEAYVRLTSKQSHVELEVADHGLGFDRDSLDSGQGFGLFSLQERAHALGGTVELDSSAGRGTRVTVVLPTGSA